MPECPLGVNPDDCRKQFSELHVKCALLHSQIMDSVRKEFVTKDEYAHMKKAMEERKDEEGKLWKHIRAIDKKVYAAVVVLGIAALLGRLFGRYIFG